MKDNLTTCDRCGSDACYVQEVNEKIKNYMCYGCGFITNSLMKVDSDFLKEQMESLPELYKELLMDPMLPNGLGPLFNLLI